MRFLVRKWGLAPLTQGRKRGAAPHHFPRLMKGCPLSFPVPVQKEEGLREEHGSARQIARGPLCGAAMAFPQKRPRSGGSRFVRRPRRSNARGPRKTRFAGKTNPIPATMLSDQNGYTHLKPLRNQGFHRFYSSFFQSVFYRCTKPIKSIRQDLNEIHSLFPPCSKVDCAFWGAFSLASPKII